VLAQIAEVDACTLYVVDVAPFGVSYREMHWSKNDAHGPPDVGECVSRFCPFPFNTPVLAIATSLSCQEVRVKLLNMPDHRILTRLEVVDSISAPCCWLADASSVCIMEADLSVNVVSVEEPLQWIVPYKRGVWAGARASDMMFTIMY
jgi:hypothetical protein